ESICSSGLRFPVDVALDVARMAVALNPLAEARTQSTFVRDIFGNPLRPLQPLAPSLMTWNDGLIPRLASASYESRSLPSGHLDRHRLAVLADALLDAGCQDAELVEHLRSEGMHWRGCWALDAVMGRE